MGPKQYSDEELLAHLCELADGETAPTAAEIAQADGPYQRTYRYRFGSFSAAVEQAGLELAGGGYSDGELLDWIRAFVALYGVVPRQPDADAWPGPHSTTYHRRFGSWWGAVRAAGFEPPGGADE